jgi:hypothetical protein
VQVVWVVRVKNPVEAVVVVITSLTMKQQISAVLKQLSLVLAVLR